MRRGDGSKLENRRRDNGRVKHAKEDMDEMEKTGQNEREAEQEDEDTVGGIGRGRAGKG